MAESADGRLLSAFAGSRFGHSRRPLAFRPKQGRCVSGVITLSGGRRIFLKQDRAPQSALLEREAAVLAAFEGGAGLRVAPQLIEFDPEQRILITAAAEGYAPLDRILRSGLLSAPMTSASVATALASLHEEPPKVPSAAAQSLAFPLEPVSPLTPEDFATRPAGYPQLSAALHQSRDAIDQVARRWRPTHFVHGDFKADNVLVRTDPRLREQPPVVIVDWEMAGIGDPMWDIGSFIGSLLLVWIQTLAPHAASEAALAGQDANSIRRHIGYFLLTYRHMAPGVFETTESFTLTAFQYAGIFMLHRVAVGLDITGFLDPTATLLLDFARNLLNRPEAAATALLAGVSL